MKATLATLDGLSDAVKGEYVQKDGVFVLKVEGDLPGLVSSTQVEEANRKVAEFRDTNIGHKRKIEELEAKVKSFEGIDPAKYREAMEQLEKLKATPPSDDAAKRKAEIDAAVAPLKQTIQEMQDREKKSVEREKAQAAALAREGLKSQITEVGVKLGVAEHAIPDFVRRGLDRFQIEDGKPIAKDGDVTVYSKSRPAEPLSLVEWGEGLQKEAPHLFKASTGGGATGGSGGPGPTRTVGQTDLNAIKDNLSAIAKGQVTVETAQQ